uniref:uncharacterized protein isoform X2 n=1 Tax=Myxine glutinosa TaxID=7769 RepID=UPI00358F1875
MLHDKQCFVFFIRHFLKRIICLAASYNFKSWRSQESTLCTGIRAFSQMENLLAHFLLIHLTQLQHRSVRLGCGQATGQGDSLAIT